MIKKIRRIRSHYQNINFKYLKIIQTLFVQLKLQNKNIFIYKNLLFYLADNSHINVLGKLEIGCQWQNGKYYPSQLIIRENATLEVKDDFKIFTNCNIWLNTNATLILGSGYINNGLNMSCFNRIEIGHNVAISENVTIRDSDDHFIKSPVEPSEPIVSKPITIGNNVWIGMNVTILKGVSIGDGAVIAAGSVVNKNIPPKTLAAGVPAHIKKNNIEWF
ncbi:MAG: acyltransferase [Calothrix sp. MO_167.B12]|nr:acyltransferase [Calothrix sp. MO_167.B12]